jgi:acyl-CoA synthetase (AMP-forming)/AMP-acid ligase II
MQTIRDLLAIGSPDHVAIEAPGRTPLTYGYLRQLVQETAGNFAALDIGRSDVVASVLPNGPEAATAFLATASGAAAAPLNPQYRQEEFEYYLDDLEAVALMTLAGYDTPARSAAAKLNVPIIDLVVSEGQPAGWFDIASSGSGRHADLAAPADTALVLHTSGTTARPKIVPLTHANLTASAVAIAETLELSDSDRCLNIMPLFHIHGIVAALLATLAAGGQLVCTPGFNALRFMDWLEEFEPSWYTAVPTMHQAIVGRAARRKDAARKAGLRFIRSSSAALATPVMAALEQVFQAPVIEAYGMTEAAHQMASNRLPPFVRKPGTVGVAAGPRVGIMDADGKLLGPGQTGEIVVSGPNIMNGYRNNAAATARSFVQEWFRTGDQGYADVDGYLAITGRLKEIINRGGEKVSPGEVDEILLQYPGILEAVTFAIGHRKLGEDVAAAVVGHENVVLEPDAIREHVSRHLADFKVPRRVLVLDEIPKGATGKVQRIGLAGRLGLEDAGS